MKKFIIAVGLLLVAAVFMSGCVTETEDPIVGIWHNDKKITTPSGDFDSGYYVFNADGTGFSLLQFAGELASAKVDFTWKNEGDGKYTIERPAIWYEIGVVLQVSEEFTLDGDKLTLALGEYSMEYHKQPASEYLVGLWTSEVLFPDESEESIVLMYVAEDGTGNVVAYGPDVMGIDDVLTTSFTWEEKDGVLSIVDERGHAFDLTLKNGALYNKDNEEFRKYTIEDHLLGLWLSDEPSKEAEGTFDIVILLRDNGTGVEIWTLPGSHVASAKYYFDWEMTSPTTYQAVYDDGEVWDFETVNLGLTDGGVTYSKVGYDVLAEYAKKVTA
ncbi:MAG TPA: hypothetical protein O0X63_00535 [Methanocorpusculum sp.]|nr:hypothetical protein [Methanocorpusculum sp.]